MPCACCDAKEKVEVSPEVMGWTHIEGRKWRKPSGEVFEFAPFMRGVLIINCPNCFALAA